MSHCATERTCASCRRMAGFCMSFVAQRCHPAVYSLLSCCDTSCILKSSVHFWASSAVPQTLLPEFVFCTVYCSTRRLVYFLVQFVCLSLLLKELNGLQPFLTLFVVLARIMRLKIASLNSVSQLLGGAQADAGGPHQAFSEGRG